MRITQNITANNSLYNLQQGRARLDKLAEQIGTSVNINRPSDDPNGTSLLLSIGDQIKAGDQYAGNITKATTFLHVSSTALQGMTDTINLIKKIGNSLSSGSSDLEARQLAVSQLQNLKQQMIDMGNTQSGNQSIFAGTNNNASAFTSITSAGATTAGSNSVTGLTSVAGLYVGMGVTGADVPANTTITAIDQQTGALTLSNNAINTNGASNLKFDGYFNGNDNQLNININGGSTTPFQMNVLGGALLQGGQATAPSATGTTTSGSSSVTGMSSLAGLSVGMAVGGTGIAANTTIIAINPGPGTPAITLSQNATASGAPALNFSAFNPGSVTTATPAGGAPVNILGSIGALITAIDQNDVDGIQAGLQNMETAAKQINNTQSDVALRMTRLDSMTKMNANTKSTLETIVSNTQNVDYAKLGVELTQQQTAFSASLSSTAKISQLSLLDYLK